MQTPRGLKILNAVFFLVRRLTRTGGSFYLKIYQFKKNPTAGSWITAVLIFLKKSCYRPTSCWIFFSLVYFGMKTSAGSNKPTHDHQCRFWNFHEKSLWNQRFFIKISKSPLIVLSRLIRSGRSFYLTIWRLKNKSLPRPIRIEHWTFFIKRLFVTYKNHVWYMLRFYVTHWIN